jgi:hypothetical protein
MIGDVGDRRGAGEQRDDEHADDLSPAPQRDLRRQWRVAAFAHPGQPLLISRDEGQCRCERHLKARMNDGFRREQQHAERRDGESAEGW